MIADECGPKRGWRRRPIAIFSLTGLMLAGLLMQSCITRTESDLYTITVRDTTENDLVRNQPGDRDNGVIYPSSRTVEITRNTIQYDSIENRFYPDFIRVGLFESAGLLLTGAGDRGIGSGILGVYGLFDADFAENSLDPLDTTSRNNATFGGGLYRFLIYEGRLRWFRDSPDWTIGTSAYEMILPESSDRKTMASILPLYIRKRFYLREEIPYVAVTPTFGMGWYPSHYVNLGGTFDVGSMGGLNLRAYLGYVVGLNATYSPFITDDNSPGGAATGESVNFPYFGFGVSVIDFLNRVPETYTEWKDHEHSAWRIGLLRASLLFGGEDVSVFADGSDPDQDVNLPITGVILSVANTSIALPWADYRVYAGTSLFNIVALGKNAGGVGVLPLRAGFFQTLIPDELSLEPFAEYNYFPSSFFHLGANLNLYVMERFNVGLTAGYVNGSTGIDTELAEFVRNNIGSFDDFSGFYAGFTLGIQDRIFFPQELRYNRE